MMKLIVLIIFLFTNFAYANRDITNIQFKPNIYVGKEGKSYETVAVDSGELFCIIVLIIIKL
jgi:hypothetical protein